MALICRPQIGFEFDDAFRLLRDGVAVVAVHHDDQRRADGEHPDEAARGDEGAEFEHSLATRFVAADPAGEAVQDAVPLLALGVALDLVHGEDVAERGVFADDLGPDCGT